MQGITSHNSSRNCEFQPKKFMYRSPKSRLQVKVRLKITRKSFALRYYEILFKPSLTGLIYLPLKSIM